MMAILKAIWARIKANPVAEDTAAAIALILVIGGVVFCTVHPSEAMRIGSGILAACVMVGRWAIANPEKVAALYVWLSGLFKGKDQAK